MYEFADLEGRLDRLSGRAESDEPGRGLRSEMEAMLSEGYVRALGADARRGRLLERLRELACDLHEPEAAKEARRLAVELRSLEQALTRLRHRLAGVRAEFVALGGDLG
jgi:hypothetical protein